MDDRLQAVLQGETDNYLAPFFWMHNEDDTLILDELRRVYDCGIRAVCLESRTHEEFCRKDWWDDCRLIMEFCREHDMKVWILDDKHFPSGYANGIYKNRPDLVQWNIVERHMDVAGPVRDGCVCADQWAMGDEILAVFACRHIPNSDLLTGETIDLTRSLSGDYVWFDLPEGMWRIVFLVKTQKGLDSRTLYYSDKLSARSTQAYIDEVYESHWANLSEYFGNVLVGFFSDEPEFGNHSAQTGWDFPREKAGIHYPWHDTVHEQLTALYGGDALRNLLPLWFDFDSLPCQQYRIDYMNIITDGYAKNFTGLIADWCHAHGVQFIGHIIEDNNAHYRTFHSAGHYFKALGPQDMAGIDVVLHQILPGLTECDHAARIGQRTANAKFFNYTLAKLASSLAHITPHMQKRAMCEIFGAYGWAEGTQIMKYLADHMLVRGINYFVPHAFSPLPDDPDCPPNFYARGDNPQYKYFGMLMGYMNRVCHMLHGSTHINTCAILYDAESAWSGGEFLPLDEVAKVLYDDQLDYDILPPDALSAMDKNGCINGERYRLVLVPDHAYLRPEVRAALENAPVRVAVVTKDGADGLSGFAAVALDDLPSYVRGLGLGDVQMQDPDIHLRYHHAVRNGAHIYLFTNEDVSRTMDTTVSLRDFAGGSYILYDAFENQARLVTADSVHLTLPPYHSVMLLCGDVELAHIPAAAQAHQLSARPLSAEYTISMRTRDDRPFELYKKTDALFNITGRDAQPHFSGTVQYTASVTLTGAETVLDLGRVGETAQVCLNGRSAGIRLFPPYRFDIAGLARPGQNQLTVQVTNTLGYRIHEEFSKFLLLPPTGMLGPVTVE